MDNQEQAPQDPQPTDVQMHEQEDKPAEPRQQPLPVSSQLVRNFFERLTKGDLEEIINMVQSYGLDVATLKND